MEPGRRLLSQHWPLAIILGTYSVLLLVLPLGMQAMEAYAYAAGVEGYYNLSQTFALMTPGKPLPDISLYHPNHPLAHLLPGLLHQAFGFDAMNMFRIRNGTCSLVFIFFFYLSALRLVAQRAAVAWATIMVMFTFVFWSSALSGETQIPALAMVMVTAYFLIRYFEPDASRPAHLVAAVFCYVVAAGCHMSVVMFTVPAGLAVLVYSRSRDKIFLYVSLLLVVVAGFALFYGLLFVHFLKIDSWDTYQRTLFIYYPLLVRQYASPEWWLATGKSFLLSVSYAENVWGGAARLSAIIVIVLGYAALWRSAVSRGAKFLLFAWPISQMVIQVIVNGRPDGTNFWLFLTPPFYLAAAFGFRRLGVLLRGQPVLFFMVGAVAIGNLFAYVLPSTLLKRNEYIYLEKHPRLAENPPLAVIVSEPVLTFAEIWWAGSRLGLKNQKIFFPCCNETDAAEHLRGWAAGQRGFLLMSDESSRGIAREFAARKDFRCTVLQERRGKIRSAVIPVTVSVDFPPDGFVQKSLLLYDCAR